MSNFLSEMREFLARELKARSIESQDAEDISEGITVHFRQNYGGVPIYIHKKSNDYAERNAEIYRKFNGRNALQLCREYDLCYQQICKIIKEQRDKNCKK
jgi:Mor family transcriptional regulator